MRDEMSYIYIYIYIYIYMCVCVCVCIYIYIYLTERLEFLTFLYFTGTLYCLVKMFVLGEQRCKVAC